MKPGVVLTLRSVKVEKSLSVVWIYTLKYGGQSEFLGLNGRWRQEDLEFKARLGYIVSLRSAWAT
jgi:hypothetical protein